MIKTRQVVRNVFVKEFVVCNKCGYEQKIEEIDNGRDFTDIRHVAGYCSNNDGDSYTSNICEPCMLAFYATFKVSPLRIPANATLKELQDLAVEREGELTSCVEERMTQIKTECRHTSTPLLKDDDHWIEWCCLCGSVRYYENKRGNLEWGPWTSPQNIFVLPISDIQVEQKEWSQRNFGPHPAWQPLLGVQEEVGELSHAFLKREQGIRNTRAVHDANIRDAVGDIVIYLLDFCNCEGIDLQEVVSDVWKKVRQRDWTKNKKDGT